MFFCLFVCCLLDFSSQLNSAIEKVGLFPSVFFFVFFFLSRDRKASNASSAMIPASLTNPSTTLDGGDVDHLSVADLRDLRRSLSRRGSATLRL